jgi:nitrogen regulatory protein PII-like uncharacterized protein
MSTPSNRRQLFLAQPGCDVQYQGSKSFWKTRTNIDLLIVNHKKYNCLEVICYDPEKGIEAPRIYLNNNVLISKVDLEEIKQRLEEKTEASLRQKKTINIPDAQKELVVSAINLFITSRLQLADDLSNGLKVFVCPIGGDIINEETKQIDIIMETVPAALVPLPTCFQKKLK